MNKSLKTIALMCIISVCSALSLHAQRYDFYFVDERPFVDLGVKAGIGLTSASYQNSLNDTESRTGANFGFIVDFNLPSNIMIMTGLDFKNRGTKLKNVEGRMNSMYLSIPLQLGYRILASEVTDFNLFAGPYFAYGIGGDTFFSDPTGEQFGFPVEKVDNFGKYGYTKRVDVGLTFGVGVTFKQQFLIRASYDLGLTDIKKKPEEITNQYFRDAIGSIKNKGLFLAFGVLI